MYTIITGNKNAIKEMNDLWNEVTQKEGFYKPLSLDEYQEKLESIPGFSYEGVFLAYKGETLIGMIIGILKGDLALNPNAPGCINALLVKEEERDHGVGSLLLEKVEDYFKKNNRKYSFAYGYLPSCYAWYIPRTDHHDHPCAPGIRLNSNEYFFLLSKKYEATGFQDAFHLDLCDYEISSSIADILEKNKKDGISIEIYDPKRHFGVDEFCKELNLYDFEKVIKENLALPNPYPFLVVVQNGKVKGWTGAMWNEESGRGHFDGIAILESVRGRGLGKALFSLLAYHSKLNGAKFMTFYTGLTNHARYIYLGAGFKIIQSFCIMKKNLN